MNADLKRIRELMPKRRIAARPDSFFYKFDRTLAADPSRLKILTEVEADLACLDEAAWSALKAQAARYLACNPTSGWEFLFNTFNEAKGYRHLQALGCKDIIFIAPSYDRKTPDLTATLGGQAVLCEVKTITTSTEVKIRKILAEAKEQLDAYNRDARKIIYVVAYQAAKAGLEAVLKTAPISGVEVEIYTLLRP